MFAAMPQTALLLPTLGTFWGGSDFVRLVLLGQKNDGCQNGLWRLKVQIPMIFGFGIAYIAFKQLA